MRVASRRTPPTRRCAAAAPATTRSRWWCYDPAVVDYDALLKVFWEVHDPTQFMGQGNDIGTQYRSEIYVASAQQRAAAEASLASYQRSLGEAGFGEITTTVVDAPTFYFAEDYHQQYLHRNPGGYCNHGVCQVAYAGADA